MQFISFTFFICALFAMIMNLQVNMDGDLKTMNRIKTANDFAVHDGAIPLDLSNISQGIYLFDKDKGRQNFNASIEYALDVKWNGAEFVPNETSSLQHTIQIKYLEFVDSSNTACPSFPCSYNIPVINKSENLSGPSVIAILETKTPRYFSGESQQITRLSIYEYK